MALLSNTQNPSSPSKAGTLPAGNLWRDLGVRLVWPKWKWAGAESTRTWAPLYWAAMRALKTLQFSGYVYRVPAAMVIPQRKGPLAHFLIGSFIFLELSCRSCLYIFEIDSLSVASFAIIFSHSEGCLFTLLIVSFVVQKLLSLIRSNLFILAFISNILGGGSYRILLWFM